MSASVNVAETAVPIGAAGTSQQVRNVVGSVMINGVLTPVLMQVVLLSDQNANILDMNLARRLDVMNQLLVDIRKEMMISNELMAISLGQPATNPITIDLDKEYRLDSSYDYPNT